MKIFDRGVITLVIYNPPSTKTFLRDLGVAREILDRFIYLLNGILNEIGIKGETPNVAPELTTISVEVGV